MVSSTGDRSGGHDDAALDEIDLAGELMIAATASPGDRLPTERIDEVLLDRVVPRPTPEPAGEANGHGADPPSS
ncbi:hypothetical protein [Streptomyces sp. NRRL WC-3742]|uniref:hypothetical protein n=1 Tax=Streptomyces sp. NRRL WC-3742 TaxID=1463934 RepID=UPI0007C5C385|nr:hypothetical protein [Streptomyces sp. NRRL WC-3742]